MNLKSTNNSIKISYYRYKITDINDISESTYLKRLTKSRQNNRNSFFFEIECDSKTLEITTQFLAEKSTENDLILYPPKNYNLVNKLLSHKNLIVKISNTDELNHLINLKPAKSTQILFCPKIYSNLKIFAEHYLTSPEQFIYFWMFSPYNPDIPNSITTKQIMSFDIIYNKIKGLDIYNNKIPEHYELEPLENTSYKINWEFISPNPNPIISVIIPSYNNSLFLTNVVWHLINQNINKDLYEIIVTDDGSNDNSSQILNQLFLPYKNKVNIKYIYWSKHHPTKGEQHFFRPGLARNLAARYSKGQFLQFLDSDILVPENFIETCLNEFKKNDIIQFQRFHIHQEVSKSNPNYSQINIKTDTYIEEKEYWSELFFCDKWKDLPNYWKYTCTYALGIKKDQFYDLGLFKKYYISYGFEDTDLGYEAHKKDLKFNLVKLPLLHLTAYDQMQYKNSFSKRFKLLRVTAELFFLQHLDKEIFHLLGNFYRAQKPIKCMIRDIFS